MLGEVKELNLLLDDQGRITFPVKITGIPPELRTVPDTSAILKDAVKNTVREEVKDKVIGGIKDLFGGKK